jgi:hypothetical protein
VTRWAPLLCLSLACGSSRFIRPDPLAGSSRTEIISACAAGGLQPTGPAWADVQAAPDAPLATDRVIAVSAGVGTILAVATGVLLAATSVKDPYGHPVLTFNVHFGGGF